MSRPVAILALAALCAGAPGLARACVPSLLTAEQRQEQAVTYQAGYWSGAGTVQVAVVTGVSRTWTPEDGGLNPSRAGAAPPMLRDVVRMELTLTPILTLKGEGGAEPITLSFNRPIVTMPVCNAPLWRTHEDEPDIGSRYLVYSKFATAQVGGDVQTVLSADLKDATTQAAWDAAAQR